MESITHREMRNGSAEVLRRVEAGESILVTNRGTPTAVIRPVGSDPLAEAEARGQVRRALAPISAICDIEPVSSPVSTADLIADVRGSV